MQIVKRNGEIATFDCNKIINAINKAFKEVDGQVYETDTATDIALEIGNLADKNQKMLTVEEIQDLVENYLMRSERPDVARAYIRYRYKKEIARNFKKDFLDAILEKLNASDVQNQNANVDEHSFGGRTGEAASVMTKRLALDYLISSKAKERHENNEIYIHDLDAYFIGSHNCLSIPFDDLLAKGFNTRQTDVRPANSINTACQLVAVIFQLQSLQQFGGVSATHIDWTMVPYIRKSFVKHYIDGIKYIKPSLYNSNMESKEYRLNLEKYSIDDVEFWTDHGCDNDIYNYALDMTKKETKQAVEGLYHNLNTLQSRSGNQLN